MGEVKTALVLIAVGSAGAVARQETDASVTAGVSGGHAKQGACDFEDLSRKKNKRSSKMISESQFSVVSRKDLVTATTYCISQWKNTLNSNQHDVMLGFFPVP